VLTCPGSSAGESGSTLAQLSIAAVYYARRNANKTPRVGDTHAIRRDIVGAWAR
jgi:hypothetical protein